MLKTTLLLLAFVPFLVAAGCSKEPGTSPAPEVPESGGAVTPETPANETPAPAGQTEEPATPSDSSTSQTEEVKLEIKSWDKTQELIAQHKGKIVVVDVWATYCAPCLIEFPNLVQLHKKHSDQIACLSISLDYQGFEDEPVETYTKPVLAVLKKQGATFQNILCSTASDTVYNEKIKQGSIPIVYVYGKDGQLAGQFPNPEDPAEFTYQEDVLPLVTKLMNQ